jgi:hypothetical protein
MSMASRFFLVPFLPTLTFDAQPELTLHELEFFLRLNLSSAEMETVSQLYLRYDIENIRSFLEGLPMTAVGKIPHDDLRDQLESEECSIPGVSEFFAQYKTPAERAANAHLLPRYFLTHSPADLPPFIHKYFRFEHLGRLLMASLRAEALGRVFEVTPEEVGFDIHDQKAWPDEFAPLVTIWHARHHHPKELEEAISEWKFQILGSLIADCSPFSLDRVLAYILQLRILESRREMKTANHIPTLERIVEAVK